ncbi:MAG: LysR family transcriptional regulator [Bacilli bacterium]|nr:LysR family transcriptional regulator [Bacilli bacterium]
MFDNNINLNLYKVFYDVTKYGTFSKTAEFTYTTQSAVSKSIKKLEEQLNTKLFYRNNHGIELTEKGKQLLYYVEKSYGNLLTAERVMLETENLERGKLTIGLPSYISSFFFMDLITSFHNKYPNIEITLLNGPHAYLLDLLDKHQIDFMIYSSINVEDKELETVKLYTVNYSFVCKKEDYDKYKSIKNIEDLENVPLVLPIPSTNNRKYIDEIFIKHNIIPKKTINIHTSEGILTAVKKGLGIGYVIEDIYKNDNNYKKININEKLREEDIIMIYNKKFLTNAPIRFIEEFIKIKIK